MRFSLVFPFCRYRFRLKSRLCFGGCPKQKIFGQHINLCKLYPYLLSSGTGTSFEAILMFAFCYCAAPQKFQDYDEEADDQVGWMVAATDWTIKDK